jgi:hypothetical protein
MSEKIYTPNQSTESLSAFKNLSKLIPALTLVFLTSCSQQKPEKSYPWTDYSKPENQFGYQPPVAEVKKDKKQAESEKYYYTAAYECYKKDVYAFNFMQYETAKAREKYLKVTGNGSYEAYTKYANMKEKLKAFQVNYRQRLSTACINLGTAYMKKYNTKGNPNIKSTFGGGNVDFMADGYDLNQETKDKIKADKNRKELLPQFENLKVPELDANF